MSTLKILFLHNGEPLRAKDDAEKNELHKISEDLHQKLSHFTEAINAEKGHVTVYLTPAPTPRRDPYKNFNFHVVIEGVSANLHEKIKKSGAIS